MKQILILAGAAALLSTTPAYAKPGHGNPHGNHGAMGYGTGGCPPGLAKKHNGCLPPGQAKKVYRDAVVGRHVPPNAVYTIPRDVRVTLPRPPAGYRYAVVNDQVVLVSRTDVVVDIIRNIIG